MESTLVSIFICVVLPVAIVVIVFAARVNSDDHKAKVLIKAIESDKDINIQQLAESLQRPKRTPEELLNLRLLRGCIFSLIGIVFCIFAIFKACSGFPYYSISAPFAVGGLSLAVGLSYLIVYFITRKSLK